MEREPETLSELFAGMFVPPELIPDWDALERRLAAIEARQRLYRQHDPTCMLVYLGADDLGPPRSNSGCTCWVDAEAGE